MNCLFYCSLYFYMCLKYPVIKIFSVAYLIDVEWDLMFKIFIFLVRVSFSIFQITNSGFLICELPFFCTVPIFALACLFFTHQCQTCMYSGYQSFDVDSYVGCRLLFPVCHSVQFSCSVMSNCLQPFGLQHTRLPCPSPIPRACSKLISIHRVSDTIQPSHLLSSPSSPAFNLSQHQGLF